MRKRLKTMVANLNLSTTQRKKVKAQLLAMAAFMILGCGNLLYGKIKSHEYYLQLKEAEVQARTPTTRRRLPMLTPTSDIDQDTQHRIRLQSRLGFYSLVALGGKCFLVIAMAFLFLVLVTLRRQPPDEGNTQ